MPTCNHQLRCGLAISMVSVALLACSANTASSPHPSNTATTTTAAAAPPPMPAPRTEKWIDLAVGDCLAELPHIDLGEVDVKLVDCAANHNAEVYFRGPLTVNAAIPDVADRECSAQFSTYTGQPVDGSRFTVTYLVDSNQDRTTIAPTAGPAPSTVICLLESADGQPLSGSARR